MSLLFSINELNENLLPYEGEVLYYGIVLGEKDIKLYHEKLMFEIEWKNDEAIVYGKHLTTKRKVAWYAEKEFSYTYSNVTKSALIFPEWLIELKNKIENLTHQKYNSCLLNLYATGEEGMSFHSDGEKELRKNGSIASLSIGAERKFVFKHKRSSEKVSVFLESGSLLEMKGETQSNWLHSLPPTKKVSTPRINLTFRQMGE